MELDHNQAALIITATDEGEITVDIAGTDLGNFAGLICTVMAKKLMADEDFQTEIMERIEDEQQ